MIPKISANQPLRENVRIIPTKETTVHIIRKDLINMLNYLNFQNETIDCGLQSYN